MGEVTKERLRILREADAIFINELKNVGEYENHLWGKNNANGKSSKEFRVYKIHGDYEITAPVFEDGKRILRPVKVPVEIQLQPMESFLRVHFDTKTSVESYEYRKAQAIGSTGWPKKIGDREVFLPHMETSDGQQELAALMDEE